MSSKIAEECIEQGSLDKAKEVCSAMDYIRVDTIGPRIVSEYIKLGLLDDAEIVANNLSSAEKDNCLLEIASVYFSRGLYDRAIDISDPVSYEAKQVLYFKIVDAYIQEDLIEKAEQVCSKVPSYCFSSLEKDYYTKIAKAYFQKADVENAIRILHKYLFEREEKKRLIKEFALLCCQNAKYADSIKFIQKSYEDHEELKMRSLIPSLMIIVNMAILMRLCS